MGSVVLGCYWVCFVFCEFLLRLGLLLGLGCLEFWLIGVVVVGVGVVVCGCFGLWYV